jgi:short-subunit dehydrogenase
MIHSRSKGTALITGASAGIGAINADRLAKLKRAAARARHSSVPCRGGAW